jgi:GTPase SAR1 family protein
MKILVMGLPGSGKTTLSEVLAKKLSAAYFNADAVRAMFGDWNFDTKARERQASRMAKLANQALSEGASFVVADFVCPTQNTRTLFNADYTVFMNTIESGRFEDTNRVFTWPYTADFMITEWGNVEEQVQDIITDIKRKILPPQFNSKAPTGLMIGRYQPFHDGHKKLFQEILAREGQVLIAVRDTQGTDEKNPFDFNQVTIGIETALTKYKGKYKIIYLPNITGVYYGRDVGYKVEKINLDAATESISATKIRKEMGL